MRGRFLAGVYLCVLGFVASFLLGRRSLLAGLAAVLTTGYFYGIVRANYLDTFAHFIFDAAVLGFYLSQVGRLRVLAGRAWGKQLQWWVFLLVGWAVVMCAIPLQPPLIQLVGLRGNAFLVPFLLVGGWIERRDANRLALWLATLNLTAFAFALAEFRLGVPAFFPKNEVTELIYRSTVAHYTAYRIPACFCNAHSYGGAMVLSLPWLVGAWVQGGRHLYQHLFLGASVAVSLLGVFMAGARLPIVLLSVLICVTLLSGKLRGAYWLGWIVIVAGIGYMVSGEERFQRFTTLRDTDFVRERIAGSVNSSFIEVLTRYPLGNGLGAGGTSIPYFLQGRVLAPVVIENEYARILLELGLPGLILWAAFIVWTIMMRPYGDHDPWLLGAVCSGTPP